MSEPHEDLLVRFGLMGLGVIFIALAYVVWSSLGYLNVPAIMVETLLSVLGVALLVQSARTSTPTIENSIHIYSIIIAAGALTFMVYLFYQMPAFGTDELAIDYYAAHQFLLGLNPYKPVNMLEVFTYYHVANYFVTPLTVGGVVKTLGYPALSFLIYTPLAAFNVKPTLLLISFAIFPFIILSYHYRREGMHYAYPLAALVILANIEYLYFAAGSVTDIVWVVFVMLSYVLIDKRSATSGVLLGLAMSAKQLPWLLAPFMLYFVYREQGFRSAVKFLCAVVATFLALNAYFFLISPREYLLSVFSPETMPLIGIGYGLSQLAFLGYLNIPRTVFSAISVIVFASTFGVYVALYKELKHAFFALPALVMLFNYRVLANYLFYWPILLLPTLPYLVRVTKVGERALQEEIVYTDRRPRFGSSYARGVISIAAIALLSFATAATVEYAVPIGNSLVVNRVTGYANPYGIPGYVTELQVNVSYYGSPDSVPVFFRIIPSGPIVNANGLLWTVVGNNTLSYGSSRVFTIVPETSADFLPEGDCFRLEAYYAGMQGFIDGCAPKLPAPLIANPNFSYFEGASTPGWSWVPNNVGGSSEFSVVFSPHGVSLTITPQVNGSWTAAQLIQPINLSKLEDCTLILNASSTLQSAVNTGGWPTQFLGVEFVFSGGQQIWVGYNSSYPIPVYYNPSQSLVVILSRSLIIRFSQVQAVAEEMGWPLSGVEMMLIFATTHTYIGRPSLTATFYNLVVVRNEG